MALDLADFNKFMSTQDSIAANPQPAPPGEAIAFPSAGGQPPSPVSAPPDGIQPEPAGQNFAEENPHLNAFARGLGNSATLGAVDLATDEIFTTEGMAQLAGQAVGEIPFWFVGGKLTSMALRQGAKSIRAIEQAGGAFGKVAKFTRVHGVNVGQAATAVGVDVGRAVVGNDPDALSASRLALDVSMPFASSIIKIARTRGVHRRAQERLSHAHDANTARVNAEISGEAPLSVAEHRVKQAELNQAYDALTPEDANILRQMDDVFTAHGGDPGHIESQMNLIRMGAPIDEVAVLHNIDDVGEYLQFHRNYPINKPAAKTTWREIATTRQNQDLSVIRERLTIRNRDYGPQGQIGGKSRLGELAEEGEEAILSRPGKPVNTKTPIRSAGKFTSVRTLAQRPRNTVVGEAAETGMIEQHMRHPVHGSSGVGDFQLDEAGEAGFDAAYDRLNDITRVEVPKGKIGDAARTFMDGVSGLPVINDMVISAVRVVESMGPAGRQMGVLLRKARMWNAMRTGQAQADMLNAFNKMESAEQYQQLVGHLARGDATSDPAVRVAAEAFRTHHKYVEGMLVRQEVTVLMADGKTKNLLGDMLEENFFPQVHNWDKVLKEETTLSTIGSNLRKKFGNVFGGITDKQIGEQYIHKARNMKMPRFSSLYERNMNLPGWLGDPESLATRGNKGYIADVQESILNFFEDSYSLAGSNRVFGAPKGFKLFDDTNMLTDLAPVHSFLKKIINQSEDTLRASIKAGKDLPLKHKKISAFETPKGVEIAANQGSKEARGLLNQARQHFGDDPEYKQLPWKMQTLLSQMKEDGHNVKIAQDLLESVMGTRAFRPDHIKASEAARNLQIITKLGTLVVENIGQVSFTTTKVGVTNALKGLHALMRDWSGSVEFARVAGVLGENAIRGLEAEAGRSMAGRFLKSSGFQFSENLLRTHAAVSGKIWVEDLFRTVAKGPTNHTAKIALRKLEKIGFDTKQFVKDGQLTEFGLDVMKGLDGNSEQKGLARMIQKMAGFEVSHQTQFLVDVIDSPIFQSTPMGKVMLQYKSFLSNTTKFVVRDVFDEARQGNPMPLIRMVLTGITIGEITQSARQLATGEDPASRGQQGWIRDLIADVPDDDEAAVAWMGKQFSESDVAARLVENVVGIGYGGMFVAMLQSATTGGKLRMMEFLGGPTVGTIVDTGAAVAKAAGGDGSQLARRALREGGGIAGTLTGIPGAAFAGAAAGKSLAIAAVPTEFQQERSLYTTPEEMAEVTKRQVVRSYNEVRNLAVTEVANGNNSKAVQILSNWNSKISGQIERLISVGGLNSGVVQRIMFDDADIKRVLSPQTEEPGAFDQTVARLGAGADRVEEIF
jgi:hypothetical protein